MIGRARGMACRLSAIWGSDRAMKVHGNYVVDGYAFIEGLVPPEVAAAMLGCVGAGLGGADNSFPGFQNREILTRQPTVEIPGHSFLPMLTFLWGLTPIVCELTGCDLLPSFDYFRIYQKGDICRLHTDRPSSEHSLSMTLRYSDDQPWALDIARLPSDAPVSTLDEDFGEDAYSSFEMKPGDAVLYRGVERRHGRITPNPNNLSAHLFLHWVERGGKYEDHAFDSARLAEVRQQEQPRVRATIQTSRA
jgi:hypothetical protein